jgi:thioredoxin 2
MSTRRTLVKAEVDAAPVLSRRFKARTVPTLLVLRDGDMPARRPGAAPLPSLRTWLDEALSDLTDDDA